MYHLVGNALKVPFWDRVRKNRVLKMFFDFFLNRVASGGARWDPITLLAKEHIGITSYRKCMIAQIWNWPLAEKVRQLSKLCPTARASHSACWTQWPPCFLGKGEHEPGDTTSNSLAPAWPSMCARQTQIMAPIRLC